jgi:heme-degrading monooxygenase HmoA
MTLEVALIDVQPGAEPAFSRAYAQARELLSSAVGCQAVRMTQGVETPTRFVLLVEWESLPAHQAFRDSPQFATWRGLIGPHFARPPHIEHFEDLTTRP